MRRIIKSRAGSLVFQPLMGLTLRFINFDKLLFKLQATHQNHIGLMEKYRPMEERSLSQAVLLLQSPISKGLVVMDCNQFGAVISLPTHTTLVLGLNSGEVAYEFSFKAFFYSLDVCMHYGILGASLEVDAKSLPVSRW